MSSFTNITNHTQVNSLHAKITGVSALQLCLKFEDPPPPPRNFPNIVLDVR